MGLPWPLAGAGLSVLPKPGKFMVPLKYLFAAVIFAAGVYYAILGIRLLPSNDLAAELDGFAALEAAKLASAKSGKPVLVKFTASWCKNCHAMEKQVFEDPEVAAEIREKFILVTFPMEDYNNPRFQTLRKTWNIPGLPASVILRGNGPLTATDGKP